MNTLSIDEVKKMMPKNADGSERFYFLPEEYSERLKVARKTILNALGRELDFKQVHNKRMIRVDAFQAWLTGKTERYVR